MKFRFKKGDILRMKENNRLVSPLGKDYEKNLLVVFSFWDGVTDVYVLDVRDNYICIVCRGEGLEYDPDYMDTPNEGTENEEPSKGFISQETAEELGKQMESMRKAGEVENEYKKKLLDALNDIRPSLSALKDVSGTTIHLIHKTLSERLKNTKNKEYGIIPL